MTRLEDRQTLIGQIAEARGNGARQVPAACASGTASSRRLMTMTGMTGQWDASSSVFMLRK